VHIDGMGSLDKALRQMEKSQYLDEQNPMITVN
jgi:hypothetical protein